MLQKGSLITAIEVKSGRPKGLAGMQAFLKAYPQAYRNVINTPETSLEDFLLGNVDLFLV